MSQIWCGEGSETLTMEWTVRRNSLSFQLLLGIWHLALPLLDWVRWADWTQGMDGVREAHSQGQTGRWTDGWMGMYRCTETSGKAPGKSRGTSKEPLFCRRASQVQLVGGWLTVYTQLLSKICCDWALLNHDEMLQSTQRYKQKWDAPNYLLYQHPESSPLCPQTKPEAQRLSPHPGVDSTTVYAWEQANSLCSCRALTQNDISPLKTAMLTHNKWIQSTNKHLTCSSCIHTTIRNESRFKLDTRCSSFISETSKNQAQPHYSFGFLRSTSLLISRFRNMTISFPLSFFMTVNKSFVIPLSFDIWLWLTREPSTREWFL